MLSFHATTIISARRERAVAVAGDGQVSLGDTIAKADAVKVRNPFEANELTSLVSGIP